MREYSLRFKINFDSLKGYYFKKDYPVYFSQPIKTKKLAEANFLLGIYKLVISYLLIKGL
jgi:hypothetical protein